MAVCLANEMRAAFERGHVVFSDEQRYRHGQSSDCSQRLCIVRHCAHVFLRQFGPCVSPDHGLDGRERSGQGGDRLEDSGRTRKPSVRQPRADAALARQLNQIEVAIGGLAILRSTSEAACGQQQSGVARGLVKCRLQGDGGAK